MLLCQNNLFEEDEEERASLSDDEKEYDKANLLNM